MAELSDTIASNAQGPRKASGDSGSMEQHSLPDQIAADLHTSAKSAAKKGLPMRHFKLVPPSPSGVNIERY